MTTFPIEAPETIAAWIPDPSAFTIVRLIRGIVTETGKEPRRPFRLLPYDFHQACGDLEASPAHVLITSTLTSRYFQRLARNSRVAVNLFGDLDETVARSIRLDDEEAGRMGARHLLRLGLPEYAYLGLAFRWSDDRREGFFEVMNEAGHHPHELRGEDQGDMEERYTVWNTPTRRLRSWIQSLPRPCGVMCACDVVSLAASRIIRSLGLNIPRDLAILGVDNTELHCEYGEVPLSSVDPDHEGLAAAAVRFALECLTNPDPVERTRWHSPSGVMQRFSTQLLAMEDPQLTKALEYIRTHIGGRLGVDEVAAAVGISRRQLYRRFENRFKRTVGEEIRRVRLEEALRLIRETGLPLQTIADQCGYTYSTYLSRAVKKETGQSPREMRKFPCQRDAGQ